MGRRISIVVSSLAVLLGARSFAQELIQNGSFEQTGLTSCNYNLGNAVFSANMPNVTAFGVANEIDVMSKTCPTYGLLPIHGTQKIGIASRFPLDNGVDAFSFTLATPIVAGATYHLSFLAHAVLMSFSPEIGAVQIGLSNDPLSSGTLIYAGTPSATAWTPLGTTFVAPIGATHLTVRQQVDKDSWNHIDAFSLKQVWTDLGHGLAGTSGIPSLVGSGSLAPGGSGSLALTQARPSAASFLFLSWQSSPFVTFGGFLVPYPYVLALPVLTDPLGQFTIQWNSLPGGFAGQSIYCQYLVDDPVAIFGVAFSNAVRGSVP